MTTPAHENSTPSHLLRDDSGAQPPLFDVEPMSSSSASPDIEAIPHSGNLEDPALQDRPPVEHDTDLLTATRDGLYDKVPRSIEGTVLDNSPEPGKNKPL